MEQIDYVITRFREYIDWVQYIPENVTKIYIYNKGPDDNLFKSYVPSGDMCNKMIVIKEKNVGRTDHTLVYHILKHWDSLPDILVNLPGTVLMNEKKGKYFAAVNGSLKKLNSNYKGFFAPRFRKVSSSFNYSINNYEPESIPNRFGINNVVFVKSEYPDFKHWKESVIDTRPINYISMRSTFAVSRNNILHINKEIYERILESLSVGDNTENAHFVERIWAHLFRQYSFDVLRNIS